MIRRGEGLFKRLSSSLSVLKTLESRGLVSEHTRFESCATGSRGAVYVGFDPTADSLHLGNLLTLVSLIHFQCAGHQPIAVVGGATGVIGDPSGRHSERERLAPGVLEGNAAGIRECIARVFANARALLPAPSGARDVPGLKLLDNIEWYKDMNVVDFLSDTGRHFRLSSMLQKDSVRLRLSSQEGMSLTEFSYPLFQAYDYLHLHRHHKCWLQLGGADQWGNISAGCEFVNKCTEKEVHGLTVPLLVSSSGEKIGKSAGNAVWLSPARTSPYKLYQHFLRTTDQDVGTLLKQFTFLGMGELEAALSSHKERPEERLAQKCLAEQVTRLVHGEDGFRHAVTATAALFGDKDALTKLPGDVLEQVFEDAPSCSLPRSLFLDRALGLVEVVARSGALKSKNEARRMIESGGLYVNHQRVESIKEAFDCSSHMLPGDITVLRIGKTRHHLVRWH